MSAGDAVAVAAKTASARRDSTPSAVGTSKKEAAEPKRVNANTFKPIETAAPKPQRKEPAIIQRTAKPGAIVTPQQNKLLDVGAEIAGTRLDEYGEFMSFTHAVLVPGRLAASENRRP